MLTTTYAGYSDVGRQRSRNDDRWAADPGQRLYVVADGVGKSKRGDLAAELVVELLPSYVARHFAGTDLADREAPARFGRGAATPIPASPAPTPLSSPRWSPTRAR
jgi:hypothetical protein